MVDAVIAVGGAALVFWGFVLFVRALVRWKIHEAFCMCERCARDEERRVREGAEWSAWRREIRKRVEAERR